MNDDRLLSLLSETLADAPPDDAVQAAYGAFELRHLDVQLAQLIEDVQPEVVGFGDSPALRTLLYDVDGSTVRLSIDGSELGLEARPPPRRVELHRPDVAVTLVPEPDGRVRLSDLSGPLRFTVHWDKQVARTPWMTL